MSLAPPPEPKSNQRATAQPAPPARDPWAVHIGRAAGIPIRLHFTFLLFLLWVGFSGGHGFSLPSVLFVIALFACVVLHELGHSVVARRYGIPVASITLYPIGGVAAIEKQPKPHQEFWIALAGPAVNLVIASLLGGLLTATHHAAMLNNTASLGSMNWIAFAQAILAANVLLVLFNLIPAFPMDGGRVLRALLAMRLPPVRATAIAAQIGQGIAITAGLLALFTGHLWYLLIAFFIYIGAGQEAGAYRQAALMEGTHVRDAMISDVRTLRVGDTLKEAAAVLLDTSQHDFPVLHGDAVQGILTRNGLLRGLSELGPSGYVAGAMDRAPLVVGPGEDLGAILPRLNTASGPLLVLDGDRLVGIVTADNIQEFFAIRQIAAARKVTPLGGHKNEN